jgi:competence protein ComEA
MPTPAERKALLFLSGVLLLGTGVRASRAIRGALPTDPAAEAALERQIAAVDSVRASRPSGRGRARTRRRAAARDTIRSRGAPPLQVDLDRATAEEIERLPRIGPVLANRIVADRDSLGPFGSLDGFQRVRGVGPALAKALSLHVTFSLTPRPSLANGSGDAGRARGTRRARRPRAP